MEKVIYDNLDKMEEREINLFYNKLVDTNLKKKEILKILIKKNNIEIKTKEDLERFFKRICIISDDYYLGSREWRIIQLNNKLIFNNCITKYHYPLSKNFIDNIQQILLNNNFISNLQLLKNNRFYKTLQINFIIDL